MTRWSAEKILGLGEDLLNRLPIVYQALLAGRIDYPRAMAFSEALALLDDDTARRIAAATLTKAEGWTSSRLRERLRYRTHKADPELAKRRYRTSVADRRVWIGQDSEGTAQLSGVNLPVDRAAAAEDRLDRLARAAKADGDSRTLAQLRADAMLDLLTGIAFRLRPSNDPYTTSADNEEAAFIANLATQHADPQTTPNDASNDASSEAAHAAALAACTPKTPPTPPSRSHSEAQSHGEASQGRGEHPGQPPNPSRGANICACGGVQPAQRRGQVDVVVKLTTLLCLDNDPGWLPGWGPVLADIARLSRV